MNDMNVAIIPKSDQISADDMIAGPMTIKVTDVKILAGQEQPVSIAFAGSDRVYRPCKSMSRVLVAAWGPDAKAYVGRSLTLYRDPTVLWGGMAVGGIRISHMSDLQQDMAIMLTMSKQKRAPHRVQVMKARISAPVDEMASVAAKMGAAQAAAREKSRLGTEAFKVWWSGDGKSLQPLNAPILAELRDLCAKADAAIAADPFGLPPVVDDHPAPEQLAAAEAAALAELAARDGA